MCFFKAYPLLLPLLAYSLGIIFSVESGALWRTSPWFLPFSIGLLGGCILLACIWMQSSPGKVKSVLFFFFITLGILRMSETLPQAMPQYLLQTMAEKKKISLLVKSLDFCQSKLVSIDGNKVFQHSFTGQVLAYYQAGKIYSLSTKLRFTVEAPSCPVSPGMLFRTLTKIKLPRVFQNSSSFNYPQFLKVQGISALAYLPGPEWIVPLQASESWLQKFRENGLQSLKIGLQGFSHQDLQGFWEAVLFKEKRFLSKEIERVFRHLGLSHLLVVSGLHLSLVFGFCFLPGYGFFYLIPRFRVGGLAKRFAAILALGLTGLYASVLGFSPSLTRAWWMSTALLWVLLSYGRIQLFSLLILVAWLLLLWEPGLLYQLSFQLSFMAVFALASFAQRFKVWSKKRKEELKPFSFFQKGVVSALGSTVAVQLILWPWSAFVFRQVSWIAPFSNLIFVPWFSFVLLPLAFLALVLSWVWPFAAQGVFWLIAFLTEKTFWLMERVAEYPVSFWVPKPPLWAWLVYGVVLGLFFVPDFTKNLFQKVFRRRRALIFGLSVGIVFLLGSLFYPQNNQLKLSLLDVGQGESLLLELPYKEAVLIDGGGFPASDFDMGEKVILPELLYRGINQLKVVTLTHPDVDHLKGLEFLIKHFSVEEFWIPKVFQDHPQVQNLIAKAQIKNIFIRYLQKGDYGNWHQVQWQVLWPPGQSDFSESDNNQSLVLRVCYQNICFLLTGDIEAEAEQALLASGVPLKAQVLKLAHHGSRTSSTKQFLKAVSPNYVLVSLGKNHPFGFPHTEVLRRLKEFKIQLFRTDQYGQIQIVTDGKEVLIH